MGIKKYFKLIGILGLLFVLNVYAADKSAREVDMPFYIGKVLPTPQKAKYFQEFLPLTKTAILLGQNLKPDHLLVELLKKRIKSRIGSAEVVMDLKNASRAEVIVVLGNHVLAKDLIPPARSQGYVISMKKQDGKNLVFLKGHDRLGLYWAVSSLLQLITVKNGKAVLAKAEIMDFPKVVNRGLWLGNQKRNKDFIFTFKINKAIFPSGKGLKGLMECRDKNAWRQGVTDKFTNNLKKMGAFFNPLGVNWFVSVSPIDCAPEHKINCASEKDFNSFYKICAEIAKAGGNIAVLFDDSRYPRNPEEKKVFKTAREADSYLMRKLSKKLQMEYPGTKLMLCPVFYWGPAAPANYPESRENYLLTMGELPKEIQIAWNGPHVCSSKITRSDLKWEMDLIKRKPELIMFRGGPHMFRYHYMTDPVDYSGSYFDGFFDGINTYYHAVGMPVNAAVAAHITNYLWNPQAFKPGESIKMVTEMMIGSGSFESVDKINKALSYFDQWGCKPSPGAAKKITTFKKKMAELREAYRKCYEKYPSIAIWSNFKNLISKQERLLQSLSKLDLKEFSHASESLKKIAMKEAGFAPKTDVFFSPYDFAGGHSPAHYQYRCEKRLCTWIRGQGTPISKMQTSFRLSDKSLSALNELAICAQDDDADQKCPIKICINNSTVFEGPNPFERFGWNIKKFPVGKGILKEGRNTLSIECLSKSDIAHGPPFFIVNYVVLK